MLLNDGNGTGMSKFCKLEGSYESYAGNQRVVYKQDRVSLTDWAPADYEHIDMTYWLLNAAHGEFSRRSRKKEVENHQRKRE